ncbi:MAG: hypothetical protein ACYDAG_05495 [Chloroflexota bacterium]
MSDMRTITLTTESGEAAGTIIEQDGGELSGEGRAQRLLELAPGKTFEYWVQQLPHSHYLQFHVSE